MIRRAAVLACALWLVQHLPAHAQQTRVALRDGRSLTVDLIGATRFGELVVKRGGRTLTLSTEVVHYIELPRKPTRPTQPHRLLLADGTRLRGALTSVKGGVLAYRWQSRELKLGLSNVRAVELIAGAWYRAGRLPRPHLDLGAKGRKVFDPRTLVIDESGAMLAGKRHPLSAIHALHVPPESDPDDKPVDGRGAYVRVMATEGQLLVGLLASIDGESIALDTPILGRLSMPRTSVWKLVWGAPPRRTTLGLTLVAASHGRHVILLDPSGKVMLEIPNLDKPHDVEPLADGTFLVCTYRGGRAMRIERDGSVRWEVKGLRQPIDIDMMTNGNVLVTEFQGRRLIELDPKGKVVWSLEGLKHPNEAEPVGKDRILITESGRRRVYLYDKKTQSEVWEKKGLKWPMDADWLGNGNVLITDNNAHKVIEVDAKGKVVWEYACNNPYEADRLPNGNTLIVETGKKRIIEVTRDKRIVWTSAKLDYPVAATRY